MNDFATTMPLPATAPDPAKHVRYTLGMVLGADDFDQEFAYLSGRDQWLARDLIGYGTAWGLNLSAPKADGKQRVQVEPGAAVSPRGQLIRVCKAQCADLVAWLNDATHQDDLSLHLGSPPRSSLQLYVKLCYRDCPSDPVPIPGEPCRCESETTAPSRTKDDFCLELSFDPPRQHEEDAVRRFVAWLRGIPIADPSQTGTPLDEFEKAVAALETMFDPGPASPPVDPDWDLEFGSPPANLLIAHDDVCGYLRVAFRVWVTRLRPKWRPAPPCNCGCGCGGDHNGESKPDWDDCVLLGAIRFGIGTDTTGAWVVTGDAQIDEANRPYLLHLRMIQEWLLCGRVVTTEVLGSPPAAAPIPAQPAPVEDLNGDVVKPPTANMIARIQGSPVSLKNPQQDQVLRFDSGVWKNMPLPAPADDLDGDVAKPSSANKIIKIQGSPVSLNNPQQDQVLRFDTNVWKNMPPPDLIGDAGGPVNKTVVQAIQSTPVAANAPTAGQVLVASTQGGLHWEPGDFRGSFVEHPPASGRYMIVAAGIVGPSNVITRTGANPALPNYGRLVGKFTGTPGEFILRFTGYSPPTDKFVFIVKALPINQQADSRPIVVSFDRFVPEGILLKVQFTSGELLAGPTFENFGAMVEISRYGEM